MMSLADIFQLIVLCAIIFLPLGYSARRWLPVLHLRVRQILGKPRYVKPVGVLRRNAPVRADKHDK
ncbi:MULTISPECIES: cellulose biosynthesis protein BcsF [Mangrovibacter]|uniref:Cellulose biosynthesis operon protein BcsF/YhjT n=1 Tax=Mangrovibacter plantisponsor TaxID=451513 RepID=A0A317PV38_9ENTR|nr:MULTISPECIES: cellulose biosynthesis protein BcsF [Mangrovibacter]KEA53088.1 membrane protein [Mangrovibacter sp. MFB070]PWW06607.1 cellulose biosynthesis operon protein BcsF/YhjT [Mangrovibacter plantisponsor]